jgi:hypothetical protein
MSKNNQIPIQPIQNSRPTSNLSNFNNGNINFNANQQRNVFMGNQGNQLIKPVVVMDNMNMNINNGVQIRK